MACWAWLTPGTAGEGVPDSTVYADHGRLMTRSVALAKDEVMQTWHRRSCRLVAKLAINGRTDSNQQHLLPGKLPQLHELHERRP